MSTKAQKTYCNAAYTKWMNKLAKTAKSKFGISIVFSDSQPDQYLGEHGMIVVNTKQTKENQMFSLLHEMGHAQNRSKENFNKEYALLHKHDMTGIPIRSYAFRVQLLEEEIQAWRNGEKIADKLNIKLNKRAYDNCAAICVMSYIDWAADRDWQVPPYA